MNTDHIYNFDQGDLLENPHTYQYTAYKGPDFLQGWQSSRQEAMSFLHTPQAPPKPSLDRDNNFSVQSHLEHLMQEMNEGFPEDPRIKNKVDIWVKKFEFSKRLFSEYNELLKPVDRTKYHDMEAYVRYAEIMEKAYRISAKLPYLNVLLKGLDTIIACRNRLNNRQKSRLAWLIEREIEHVQVLARKRGVWI